MKNMMNRNRIFPVSMLVLWSIVFAVAMHNWGLGICMGLCMGVVFGLFDSGGEASSLHDGKGNNAPEEEPGSRASSDKFWENLFQVRPLEKEETGNALLLAWKVFCEFESPDYAPEGTDEFKKCLNDDTYLTGIRYYGAFDDEELVGMLGIRVEKRHICFFFVDGEYQRLGIGSALFRRMLEDFPTRPITLNSSPYALPFYRAVGFNATAAEQTVNGIRFTPMAYTAKQKD